MGMNYYAKSILGQLSDDEPERGLHIGKKSWGWEFAFQAHREPSIKSWADWKTYLSQETVSIIDEENELVSLEKFVSIVEEWGAPGFVNPNTNRVLLNHYDECAQKYNLKDDFKDAAGYAFTFCEFS